MGEFIGEFLIDLVIAPVFNLLMAALWWVVRNGVLLVLYPIMLFTGWLRLWLRERGRTGFGQLWQLHGRTGLHRFGWQEAALDLEYFLATILIMLAGGGMALVLLSVGRLWL